MKNKLKFKNIGTSDSNNKQNSESAIDILEESLQLLRINFLELLPGYLIGTLPFALALIYFFNDMSKLSGDKFYLTKSVLFLTILFFWKNYFQAVYCRKIMNKLCKTPNSPQGFYKSLKLFIFQNTIQPFGFNKNANRNRYTILQN